MMRSLFIAILASLALTVSVQAATIHVPGDQPTIQAGIDAAATGDTVLVAAGTYSGTGNTDINFGGVDIVLLSEDGPTSTIIDCEGSGRALAFANGETSLSRVEGFTIKNGNAPTGGAILINGSSPTITNCVFFENTAAEYPGGGAILVDQDAGPLLISDCVFDGNVVNLALSEGFGGGIMVRPNCTVAIEDSQFMNGRAMHGGAAHNNGTISFFNCTFSDNSAVGGDGGALQMWTGTLELDGCYFHNNSASGNGGAMRIHAITPGAGATISDCVFAQNTCEERGGTYYQLGGTQPVTFSSCTIFESQSLTTNQGSAMYLGDYASPSNVLLSQTIIADGGLGDPIVCESTGVSLSLNCCDVWGNAGGNWVGCIDGQSGQNGNMEIDPRFCDAPAGDLTLQSNSPCAPDNSGGCGLIGALPVACNGPPICDAGGPYLGDQHESVEFDGTASSDPGGTIVSYTWDFGDGGAGTGAITSHVYDSPGMYTVTLTVEDDENEQSSCDTTAEITPNEPPVCDANGPYAGNVDEEIGFDGSGSSDPDGAIVSYEWDFGDGATGTTVDPTHTYGTAGTYTVTLTVTDDDAAQSSCETLADINAFPICDAGEPQAAYAGSMVLFDGTGSSDPDGTIIGYTWDFGDGSTGTGTEPSHMYSAQGTYTVTLCVADDDSASSCCVTSCDISLFEFKLLSVQDVGNDQGGQVRVQWRRAWHDTAGTDTTITSYSLWRRIDEYEKGKSEAEATDLRFPPGDWDFIESVSAHGAHHYNTISPTLCDSTIANGVCWSVFFVMAETPDPLVFYDTAPDSGYSIDNLSPAVPGNFRFISAAVLTWDGCEAPDFNYFTVYGSYADSLNSTAELIGHTVETSMDITGHWFPNYHLTATDFSGNEGDEATVGSTTGMAGAGQLPRVCALYQSHPNPGSFGSTIAFDLPTESEVSLKVFDTVGRLVTSLVDGRMAPGTHSIVWEGTNSAGRAVPSGVYFYRMEAGDFTDTKKLLITW